MTLINFESEWGQTLLLTYSSVYDKRNPIMARKPRIEYPGVFFPIIGRSNNRQDIFHDDEDRQDYSRRLAIYLSEGNITLYGF